MNLRKLRLAAVLSQKEVAQRAGINRALLSAIETGIVFASPKLAERIRTAIRLLEKSDFSAEREGETACFRPNFA